VNAHLADFLVTASECPSKYHHHHHPINTCRSDTDRSAHMRHACRRSVRMWKIGLEAPSPSMH
jgi:hypothetical protein